jgi:uncharacterized membrane protein YczE
VSRVSTALLWLFILNLGIAFGAGLCEGTIVAAWLAALKAFSLVYRHRDSVER